MNAINRYELYVLEEGEKPVEVSEDTKIPNAATIKIVKQDHTLANMIRAQLLSMPQVLFAGYKVPHPLHPYFLLKIQTDGTITPTAVLEKACTNLIGMLATLEGKFKREFALNTVEGGVQEDAYGVPTSGSGWEGGGSYVDLG
ncbi:DNA-directed RNA polymerase II [Epithele typhae]|uniref:DNA-directed RNA polymerase II n=1 Tax=Epithele typhae TaxID=378194 RepID=UPI0020081C1E|nr:DNA-directed RNA polymerase II [Epithele typhae]XP_047881053.1 DNA-directed RNA polymerase II [Epithele typhae]KAH9913793.1 DNA-directed RNA polymerase II [Epithele typhae]KAH9941571.1 DNA-directed RNA polymerase II [Epithele typhae]